MNKRIFLGEGLSFSLFLSVSLVTRKTHCFLSQKRQGKRQSLNIKFSHKRNFLFSNCVEKTFSETSKTSSEDFNNSGGVKKTFRIWKFKLILQFWTNIEQVLMRLYKFLKSSKFLNEFVYFH